MRAFVQNRMEGPADIEKRDIQALQHDTGGLPRRKLFGTNGFHLGILGAFGGFAGKHHARRSQAAWPQPRLFTSTFADKPWQ